MPGRVPAAARSLTARAAIVASLVLAACGSPVVPSAQPSGASSSPPVVPLDPATCAVEKQPGPTDRIPAGDDRFDAADAGNGRWRLCLQAPAAVSIEGSAVCTWNPDRTEVVEIDGLPVETEPDVSVEGGARVGDGADVFMTRITSGAGDRLFAIYESPDPQPVRAVAGGRSGIGAFDLELSKDPETSVAGSPPRLTGLLGWTCGLAPPPKPGRSTGLVALRLDQPIGLAWQLKAQCDWVSVGDDDRLSLVQTDSSDIHIGDRSVAIAIEPDVVDPDTAVANLFVDTGSEGIAYRSHGGLVSAEQAADARTGTLRLRHLTVDPETDLRLVDDLTDVSGIVRWDCPPPVVRGPRLAGGRPRIKRLAIPGTATATLTPGVTPPASGAIECMLGRINRDEIRVTELHGRLTSDDETLVLDIVGDDALIGVVGRDRQPAGEYVGRVGSLAANARRAPTFIDIPSATFEPTDAFYAPLGGAAAPRSIGVRIDYTCDLGALKART